MKVDLVDFTSHPRYIANENHAQFGAATVIHAFRMQFQDKPADIETLFEELSSTDIESEMIAIFKSGSSSCLEFVNLVFSFQGISHKFVFQLSKIPGASLVFQEPDLVVIEDVESTKGPTVVNTPGANDALQTEIISLYDSQIETSSDNYKSLLAANVSPGDAFGLLPTSTKTKALIKLNLRTYLYALAKRSKPEYKGEFQDAINKTLPFILDIYPWVNFFIANDIAELFENLENSIDSLVDANKLDSESANILLDLVDKIKEA